MTVSQVKFFFKTLHDFTRFDSRFDLPVMCKSIFLCKFFKISWTLSGFCFDVIDVSLE